MTPPNDAPMLELLAACEQLGEGYSRCLRAVQQLTSAGLAGRGVSSAVLLLYQEQAERAVADLEPFRAMVKHFKTQFTVHRHHWGCFGWRAGWVDEMKGGA